MRGVVHFGLDMKNKMRPLQFYKIKKGEEIKPLNPGLFKKLLLSKKNEFISFSKRVSNEEIKPIIQMLKAFHFDTEKILNVTLCEFCLEEKKFTILDEAHQIHTSKDRIICPNCAIESVIKKGKLSGLISQERVSPKLKNFFNHMILKFKNVQKVLSSFKTNFNPAKHRDLTLYDVEENAPISQKYLDKKINDLEIPEALKKVFKQQNITTLLPIQAMAVDQGLISERNDQLIMAPTSGGKTLVGEIAGVNRILQDKNARMLYVVPLVALANVRSEEFSKKYKSVQIETIKKVGESLLDKRDFENLEDLLEANIIVGTYEAIDYILRSGNKLFLGNLDTIIIDEIQTLIDEDRGFLLDGFIARLKTHYPKAQFIYLSATIGEPAVLAQRLDAKLIRYNNRPVPVERHLLLCLNENVKHKYISKLVIAAFRQKSSFGFKGQSIIFTNARKKCESLTTTLRKSGIPVEAYHSGLTNEERKIIELKFQKQKIAGVVATAALAAGVDFPASHVIFESLAMGINWLSVAEFEQMLGRAGRLKKHEMGFAYLLVEPGKIYSPRMKITEENIAIRLLNGKIRDFELSPDENKSLTDLLAFYSMFNEEVRESQVFSFYDHLINDDYDLGILIKKLKSLELLSPELGNVKVTDLGRSVAKSFLTVEQSMDIIQQLEKKTKSILEIVLDLKPLRNVYISKDVVADLAKNRRMKYFSNNFFSASVLSLMDAEYVKKKKRYSQAFIDLVLKWTREIFTCDCKDNPYCECGRLNLEKLIFSLRAEDGFSIDEISLYLEENYKIVVFKGDLIDYLESLIYSFEAIRNISRGIAHLDPLYNQELSEVPQIINKIKK